MRCRTLVACVSLLAVFLLALPANAAPLKVVCFGDSITGNRPREAYLDRYVKWSDMLGLMLEARVGTGNAVVLNRGYAGDKTYKGGGSQSPGALNRLQADILDEKPAIVVMLIGGNDKKDTAADREITRANLDALVAGSQSAGIKVLLLQYAVLANPDKPEKTWFHLAKNNELIAAVGKAHDVPVLDLQPVFDTAVKSRPHTELMNAVDGVHLAPGGELIVARAVFGKLEELGWIGTSKQ